MKRIIYVILTVLLLFFPTIVKAQFTVVDADSKEALPGVYVFADNGALLTMSNEKGEVNAVTGKVTLSVLSYESLTVDATELHGEVALKSKPLSLSEVVVHKTEFVKISAVFRDVVTNYGDVVLYREGIVDYYYNIKAKKWKTRVRACRQYEHKSLREPWNDSVACWGLRLLDFNKVQVLKQSGNSTSHGDTLMLGAMKGGTEVKDGVMAMKRADTYRVIIDEMKFNDRTSVGVLGMHYTLKKLFFDWTYDVANDDRNLKALRIYKEYDFQWSKKMPVVPVVEQSDVAVFEITYPTKDEAKTEMKDKDTDASTDFILPDCLPAMPSSIVAKGKTLVLKKFHNF